MSSFIDTPLGYKIHYKLSGDPSGQLVILTHGLCGSTATFDNFVPLLPERFHAVSVDFPGFGKSPRPSAADPLRQRAAPAPASPCSSWDTRWAPLSIYTLLLPLPPHLPLAASCFWDPAARAAMVDLAALVRAQGIAAAATKAAEVTNFYADTPERTVPALLRRSVYDAVAASDPEAYAQTCEAMVADDHVDPAYGAITCPVVFVAGDKDRISPVTRSEDLAKLVGGPVEVQVVRSGHQLILEDSEGVKLALSIFLSHVEKVEAEA
ncbi:hypothetical protein SPBR_07710 [Sporothrix brasiliensis 5110]|uniref:AB hydrolase-1 domain-containing protein n=1 Tax=Sporothrix brasiliensis 5110 TaxID=1398154 RepID=A0A0C2IUP9_9PEZI|nr:uncharacterized protein SPBR_07710 [Sporothrix brasiliensis 5110]KIH88707.1 hypothetical protein SPBR_07710 [Sporothrix brasiliensis 5110]